MAKTVLVCDDDPQLRSAVSLLIRDLVEIVEAADGQEALAAIREKRPALMLLDVGLPLMDGFRTLEAVRAIAPGLLVIVLTGQNETQNALRMLEMGASAYVTKPFEPSWLREDIKRLLAGADGVANPSESPPWRIVIPRTG